MANALAPPVNAAVHSLASLRNGNSHTTQVIYHLNNRNEDYEFELAELTERAEADAAAARADLTAKIAAARQQLQQALDEAKVRAVLRRQ